ncbi:protein phosphatase 2C 50-like, partial [Panicum virgatum]|uniref:protein phosphatase 2C 50-like n=1 Tax=Panicum virgatum TaxID=38727 RepID=UPI0019D4FD00
RGPPRPAPGSRARGKRRSVYLAEYAPAWGSAATRGRRAAMEDASAAVPRFAEVPARMLAGARELDALHGVGSAAAAAAAPKLPLHLFAVYDGHGGSEVANYCGGRMHVVLKEALGRAATARAGLEESGERLDIAELWEKVFGGCFQRVDDEVLGQASRFCSGEARCKPVAAGDVGSTAAVAVVCSSHIIVANCGDSRVVLSRGKEPVALSDDHKPDREDERARIEAAGGRVIDWNGHRVSGGQSVPILLS